MNTDVVLWKGSHLGAICDLTNTTGMSYPKVTPWSRVLPEKLTDYCGIGLY